MAVVAALCLLATPLPALAVFAINLQAPGGPAAYTGAGITIFDNAVGDDLDPTVNQIVLIPGASLSLPLITGFTVSINSSVTDPAAGTLTLNWTLFSSPIASPSTLQVTASATDYMIPTSGVGAVLTSAVGGSFGGLPNGSGSVLAQQWVDLGNGHFATVGPLVHTPGPQGLFLSPDAFSDSASVGFTSGTPYSITDRVNLSLGGGASTTGGISSTVVPEPVTMFLGGTGLLMLTYAARRRLFGR